MCVCGVRGHGVFVQQRNNEFPIITTGTGGCGVWVCCDYGDMRQDGRHAPARQPHPAAAERRVGRAPGSAAVVEVGLGRPRYPLLRTRRSEAARLTRSPSSPSCPPSSPSCSSSWRRRPAPRPRQEARRRRMTPLLRPRPPRPPPHPAVAASERMLSPTRTRRGAHPARPSWTCRRGPRRGC